MNKNDKKEALFQFSCKILRLKMELYDLKLFSEEEMHRVEHLLNIGCFSKIFQTSFKVPKNGQK